MKEKIKVAVDIDVVTINVWKEKKDVRRNEASKFFKFVEKNKEKFQLIVSKHTLNQIELWKNKPLVGRIKEFYEKIAEIKDPSSEIKSFEKARNVRIEEFAEKFAKEVKIKLEDSLTILLYSLLGVEYFVTYNKKHLRNKYGSIKTTAWKYGIKVPEIMLPFEFTSFFSQLFKQKPSSAPSNLSSYDNRICRTKSFFYFFNFPLHTPFLNLEIFKFLILSFVLIPLALPISEARSFIVYNVSNPSQIYFIVNGTTGYVGIGLSNPLYALHVIGDVYWSGTLQGGIVPWERLTGYNLNVAWSGKLGWGNLTNYPSIIAGAGLTGGGDLSTSRTLSIAFGEDFLGWRNLTDYPPGCGENQAVKVIGDTLTCIYVATPSTANVTGAGAAGQVAFWVGSSVISGDSNLYWDNTNKRLGIGTTAPEGKLMIQSSGTLGIPPTWANAHLTLYDGTNRLALDPNQIASSSDLHISTAAGDMRFYTNNVERVRITTGGNVGIGTTNPQGKLHVTGGVLRLDSNDIIFKADDTGDIVFQNADGTQKARIWAGSTAGSNVLYLSSADNIADITIDANGKVGIGTTSPTYKLHVVADGWKARFSGSEGYIDIGPANSGWAHIYTDRPAFIFNVPVYSEGNAFSSYGTGDLSLQTGGTTRIFIRNSDGNVGIGTTSPAYKLDVAGDIRATGTIYGTIVGNYGGGLTAGLTGVTAYYYVGSLPYSSASVYQKLYIQVWGGGNGAWLWYGSGIDEYVISTRDALKVYRSRKLGETLNYQLLIYNNTETSQYDVYVAVISQNYPNILIRSFKLDSPDYWVEQPVIQKTPSGTDVTSSFEFINTIITNRYGNVGIGTTAPTAKLELGDNQWIMLNALQGTAGINFYETGSKTATDVQYGGKIFYDGNSDTLRIVTRENNADKLGIAISRASGNVGIGTTDPNRKLQVVGEIAAAWDGGVNPVEWIMLWPHDSAIIAKSDNPIRIGHATDLSAAGWVERVRIDPAGNVGIGTTSPAYKLDVAGSARLMSSGASILKYNDGSVDRGWTGWANWMGGVGIYNDQGGGLLVVKDTTGNVGIGTTSPSSKLEVYNGDIEINNAAATGTYKIKGLRIFYAGDETQVSTTSTSYELKKQFTAVFNSNYGIKPRYVNVLARIWNGASGKTTNLNVTLEGCGGIVLSTSSTSPTLVPGTINTDGCSDGLYPTKVYLSTASGGTAYNDLIEFYYVQ